MESYSTDRTYFVPGDTVEVKHSMNNKPEMLVQSVDKQTIRNEKGILLGVTCIWFDKNQCLQKHRFNTKDIEKC